MPIFVLWIKAVMENVREFWPEDGQVTWTFDVKHGSSSEERKGVVIDPEEVQDVPNTKNAKANFMCKFGGKDFSYLKVLKPGEEGFPKSLVLRRQTADDREMVPWFACECRGMEPVKWTPTKSYCASGESGAVFEGIELGNEDWCDYDEKSSTSPSITKHIAHEFRLHKGK